MKPTGELRKDLQSAAAPFLIGVGYLWYAFRYPVDTLAAPGPGVFPRAIGLLLVVLTALQLARSGGQLLLARRTASPVNPLECPTDEPNGAQARRIPWLLVGILVLYLLVVSRIGFLTSTFVLVIICGKLMGTRGWVRPAALAAGLVLACYFLFSVWLKVPLPTGLIM